MDKFPKIKHFLKYRREMKAEKDLKVKELLKEYRQIITDKIKEKIKGDPEKDNFLINVPHSKDRLFEGDAAVQVFTELLDIFPKITANEEKIVTRDNIKDYIFGGNCLRLHFFK